MCIRDSAYIEEKTQLDSELRNIEECNNYIPDLNARTTLGYKSCNSRL